MGSRQSNPHDLVSGLDSLSDDCDDLLARIDALIARADAASGDGAGASAKGAAPQGSAASSRRADRCTKRDIAGLFADDPGFSSGGPDEVILRPLGGQLPTDLHITWPVDEQGQIVVMETGSFVAIDHEQIGAGQALANHLNDTVRGCVNRFVQRSDTPASDVPLYESMGVYLDPASVLENGCLLDEVRVRGSVPYTGRQSLDDVSRLSWLMGMMILELMDDLVSMQARS